MGSRIMEEARKNFIPILVLTFFYFIAGKFGLTLAFLQANATAIWPPAGIALAGLLIFGFRLWPGVLIGAFLVNVFTAGSLLTSICIAIGNTLEALTGAYLVQKYAGGIKAFDRPSDVFKYSLLAGMVCTLISATLGVTSLSLTGYAAWENYAQIWLTWWLGDMGGNLVVAPLLIFLIKDFRLDWTAKQTLEAFFLMMALIVPSIFVFGKFSPLPDANYPLEFICIPALLWSAFRFGKRESAMLMLVLSIMAIGGTLKGFGPFVRESQNESLMLLQAYISMLSIMTFVLAAAVSERKEVLEELKKANEKLKAMDRVKSNFILAASHELRTPLTAVKGYLTILLKEQAGPINSFQREFLTNTQLAAGKLHRLLNQLLSISKIESGQTSLEIKQVDMRQLLQEEISIFKIEADQKNITLTLLVENDLQNLCCDADKIHEVVSNLISNALKYTPPQGHVEVRARRDESQIEIRVTDTGIGIRPEDQEKIFEPFHRLRRSGLQGESSTGLGLSLTKRLVQLHQGRIELESKEQKGSSFRVFLPIEKKELYGT